MIDFKKEIAEAISKATNLHEEELINYVEVPPNSELGDYAFPCFKLARELKKSPQTIAEEIKDAVRTHDCARF